MAPTNIKPPENVIIVLDTKDVNHAASLGENIWNEPFRTDLTGWKKITSNIAVVSHVTNEKNFMMPFPCLNALQGSLKYLKKEGVDKIIFSGVSGPGAPMANLNFYVAASLAWNIDQPVDSLIWKYCDNHYGPAAKSMYGYYKALETAVASGNVMLSMDQSPAKEFKSWLTPNNINQLYSYFNPLAAMTQENSLLKEKIDRDRLSLIYSQLEVAKSMGTNTFGYFMNFGALKASLVRLDKPIGKTGGDEEFKGIKDADFRPIQGMRDLLEKFVQDCYDNAIRIIDSKGTTPEQYRDLTLKYMTQKVQRGIGVGQGGLFGKMATAFLAEQVGYDRHALIAFGFPSLRALRLGELLGHYQRTDRMMELNWSSKDSARRWRYRTRPWLGDPEAVDTIWAAMAADFKESIIGVRDAAYIRHRYLEHPSWHYEILLTTDRLSGRPWGLLVLRSHPDGLELIDLVAPRVRFATLIAIALRVANRTGKDRLFAWSSEAGSELLIQASASPPEIKPLDIWVLANISTPGPSPASLDGHWWLTGRDADFR